MIAVQQVLVIAMLIAVGFFLGKKKRFTQETGKQLSWLLIHIVTPMVIFKSFQMEYSPQRVLQLLETVGLAFLSFLIVIVFSFFYWGKGKNRKVERIAVSFSNVGFMGLPLVAGIYGEEGVLFASVMVMVFNVVYFTYGITVIRGNFSLKELGKILCSPTILSVFVGILFFVLRIPVPEPIYSVVESLASLNTPLAMLVAGLSISRSNLKEVIQNPITYKMAVGKLFLAPLCTAAVFMLLPVAGLVREVIVLQVGCPTAALVGISLMECGQDNRRAVDYFAVTTLLSILTIPVVKLLCQSIF